MPAKKSARKKKSTKRRSRSDAQLSYFHGDVDTSRAGADNIGVMPSGDDEELLLPPPNSNGRARKEPYYINPESAEEREQRLAARKALTLKAARIAYDNHHRRKAS